MKELIAAGANVTCGLDDINNIFLPFGRMDMLEVAMITALAAIVAVNLAWDNALDVRRTMMLLNRDQAIQVAMGAESWVATILSQDMVDSETDHRQNRLTDQQLYFQPLDEVTDFAISHLWKELSGGKSEPLVIKRKGRDVTIPEFSSGVGKASFNDLCAKPLGPGDYLAIAKALRALIITDIPKLSKANNNEAKRFVTLIDALYEAKVKLIASAAAEPERLYTDGAGAFEFERTASRLREMQSADWGA